MKNGFVRFATVAAMAAGMALAQTPAAPAAPSQTQTGKTSHRHAMRGKMWQALNLTDAQKQQAKTVMQQARQNAQPVVQQLKTNREALAAAVKANDVAKIHSLSAEQGHLRGQLLGIQSEARAKVYATLTPEQKQKADAMREGLQERMKERFGKRNANNG